MTDFPASSPPAHGCISTAGPECLVAQTMGSNNTNYSTAAVWPAANLAIYVPVTISELVTVYQMSIEVGAQSGNVDVGIYEEQGNRLVSAGSTLTGAAGVQVFDITDTILLPGTYYLAMNCSVAATATFMRQAHPVQFGRLNGVRQQAVGAVALPATATFATNAQSYVPRLSAHIMQATV